MSLCLYFRPLATRAFRLAGYVGLGLSLSGATLADDP